MRCIEQNRPLYSVFIDPMKAFDIVTREALWIILRCYGCLRKFLKLIQSLHNGMTGQVFYNGVTSTAFAISNGGKTGLSTSPSLIQSVLHLPIVTSCQSLKEEVYVRYHGQLFLTFTA